MPIPIKLRKEMSEDPFYSQCCISGLSNEKIDWHHNLRFAGKDVQKKFCILPLIKSIHDDIVAYKEKCDWIMLNRATDQEIKEISRVTDYARMKERLNEKYGVWVDQGNYKNLAIQY